MRETKSPILEAVRKAANGRNAAGVMDQVTLREFYRLCLPPVETVSPSKIKKQCPRWSYKCRMSGL